MSGRRRVTARTGADRIETNGSKRGRMQLGFVGLGKMGMNMVTRLTRGGHAVVAYDRSADAVRHATDIGATGADSLPALVQGLSSPRAVWVMVPAGDPTESTVTAL